MPMIDTYKHAALLVRYKECQAREASADGVAILPATPPKVLNS